MQTDSYRVRAIRTRGTRLPCTTAEAGVFRHTVNRMLIKHITLSFLLITFGFTASADETPLSLGNHLLSLGNDDAAITEYKRFLFFHPDDARAGEAYYHIGLAYRKQAMWTAAVTAMRTAIQITTDKETKTERQLALAVTLIANKNYDMGLLELIKVTMRNPSKPQYRRAMFLQGVAYLYQFRWEEARAALKNYTDDAALDTHFEAALKAPRKSAKLAKILSIILPGAGQVYTGNWQDGLNAFVLNGALGFATVDAALDGYYMDATLWATALFLRYYQGNYYRAGKAAEAFNARQSRRAAENILSYLRKALD